MTRLPMACYEGRVDEVRRLLDGGADIHQQIFHSTNYYTTRSIEIVRNHTRDKPTQP